MSPEPNHPTTRYNEYISRQAQRETKERRPDNDLRTQIWSNIMNLHRSSAFAFSSIATNFPNPGLHVENHGVIGLPLSQHDAQVIKSKAKQSPFGKGEETLVDTKVRNSWELDANQITLKTPEWEKAFDNVVSDVCSGLELMSGTGKVTAKLYKLLLHESGAFFKPHKDSEKVPGMFGTLVICLPSFHKGGKLIMTHGKKMYEFETENNSEFGTSFAAWYSDITHEVLPVTDGHRLVLTYNLVYSHYNPESSSPISATSIRGHEQQLSLLLQRFSDEIEEEDTDFQPLLVHKLEHQHTKASMKLDTLKGRDASQVQSLARISRALGYDIYLGSYELSVVRDDEDEDGAWYGGTGEEYERNEVIENIVDLDGNQVGEYRLKEEGYLIDPELAKESDCDEEEHSGWTGNEGMTATFWYRDSVVILVPPSGKMDFFFGTDEKRVRVLPKIRQLRKDVQNDASQKDDLHRLCLLVLSEQGFPWSPLGMHSAFQKADVMSITVPSVFQEAAAAALEIDRLDLFDLATTKTSGRVLLDNATLLGNLIARTSLSKHRHRLNKGVKAVSTLAPRLQFITAIEDGIRSGGGKDVTQEYDFKDWKDSALFNLEVPMNGLDRADCKALAELSKAVSRTYFVTKATALLLAASQLSKALFVNEYILVHKEAWDAEHQSFISLIINNIWLNFSFEGKSEEPARPQISRQPYSSKNDSTAKLFSEADFVALVSNTSEFAPEISIPETVLPAILQAVPTASEKCTFYTFLSLVRRILNDGIVELGYESQVTESSTSELQNAVIRSFLVRFIQTHVGSEPECPKNWTLPPKSCHCVACLTVNKFLRSPVETVLALPLPQTRRNHLDKTFRVINSYSHPSLGKSNVDLTPSYRIETIKEGTPFTWRIIKHRDRYEQALREWQERVKTVRGHLLDLMSTKAYEDKLRKYLGPFFYSIMNVKVADLPKIDTKTPLSEIINNVGSKYNLQKGQKRGYDMIDLTDGGPAKRTRSNTTNDTSSGKENEGREVEVVDLTDL